MLQFFTDRIVTGLHNAKLGCTVLVPCKWRVGQCMPNMSGEIGRRIFVHISVDPM